MLIAHHKHRQSGFTLAELMIGVLILGILTAVAVPSFQVMMRNAQIRTAAEAVTNGLQRARAEAVMRNTNVQFVLGLDSSWIVSVVGGVELERRSGSEGSRDVTLAAFAADLATPATTITFNNLGQVVAAADSLAQIDLDATGADRPLRVIIGVGGNARMCDPHLSSGTRAC